MLTGVAYAAPVEKLAGWTLQHDDGDGVTGAGAERCLATAPAHSVAVDLTKQHWEEGETPRVLLLLPLTGEPLAVSEEGYCSAVWKEGDEPCSRDYRADVQQPGAAFEARTLQYLYPWIGLGGMYDDDYHAFGLDGSSVQAAAQSGVIAVRWKWDSGTTTSVFDLRGVSEAFDWVERCAESQFGGDDRARGGSGG